MSIHYRFYIDLETARPHIERHGVTQAEAIEVIEHSSQDFASDRGSRKALGQTTAGRYLQVVYKRDPDGQSVFVITAFVLSEKRKKAVRRRRRK